MRKKFCSMIFEIVCGDGTVSSCHIEHRVYNRKLNKFYLFIERWIYQSKGADAMTRQRWWQDNDEFRESLITDNKYDNANNECKRFTNSSFHCHMYLGALWIMSSVTQCDSVNSVNFCFVQCQSGVLLPSWHPSLAFTVWIIIIRGRFSYMRSLRSIN